MSNLNKILAIASSLKGVGVDFGKDGNKIFDLIGVVTSVKDAKENVVNIVGQSVPAEIRRNDSAEEDMAEALIVIGAELNAIKQLMAIFVLNSIPDGGLIEKAVEPSSSELGITPKGVTRTPRPPLKAEPAKQRVATSSGDKEEQPGEQ